MKLITRFGVLLACAVGCGGTPAQKATNALTGEACEPDPMTLVAKKGAGESHGKGGANSPTGLPGDNMDDEHSGKVDCLWDGDSGQGNDTEDCTPPEGCDATGCCLDDDGDDGDASDGSDDGVAEGSDDDGAETEGTGAGDTGSGDSSSGGAGGGSSDAGTAADPLPAPVPGTTELPPVIL